MKQFFFIILSLFILMVSFSCKGKEESEYVQVRADSFATHYFNWQFEKCMKFVTPESRKYLQFAASNVTEGNVEMLRSMPEDAIVEIEDVTIEDMNHAFVKVSIHNFLAVDTIGREAKTHESGKATIRMVKKDNNWLVEMPQSLIRTAFRQQNE